MVIVCTCVVRSPLRAMANYIFLTSYVTSYLTSYVTSYLTRYLTSYLTSYVTSCFYELFNEIFDELFGEIFDELLTSLFDELFENSRLNFKMADRLDLELRDGLIERYFKLGYNHAEILSCLFLLHDRRLSLRQLKRILARRGLKRR